MIRKESSRDGVDAMRADHRCGEFPCGPSDGTHDGDKVVRRYQHYLNAAGIRSKSLRSLPDGSICLNLSGTPVTDLSPLTEIPISHLCLQGCYGITDFTPLGGMNLVWLNLCRTRIHDLRDIARLPLRHLGLRRTRTTILFHYAACR